MEIKEITTVMLIADEGKILTNGNEFAKVLTMNNTADTNKWYEISQASYEEIMEEHQKKLEAEMNENIY